MCNYRQSSETIYMGFAGLRGETDLHFLQRFSRNEQTHRLFVCFSVWLPPLCTYTAALSGLHHRCGSHFQCHCAWESCSHFETAQGTAPHYIRFGRCRKSPQVARAFWPFCSATAKNDSILENAILGITLPTLLTIKS